jgi:hypothetical protein
MWHVVSGIGVLSEVGLRFAGGDSTLDQAIANCKHYLGVAAGRVGTLILDASVLIGLLDTADAHHSRAVDDVEAADLASERLLAPAIAYSEALVSFARARRTGEARDAITAMGSP